MPRYNPHDPLSKLAMLGPLMSDAGDRPSDNSAIDMVSKLYGLSQEQAMAPYKMSLAQSEAAKNNAGAAAMPSAAEQRKAKADQEEAQAFQKYFPAGMDSVKDPYAAETLFPKGSGTAKALHSFGDRMYLQHHDPLWKEVAEGQATPEMQNSPYLNEGEKWTANQQVQDKLNSTSPQGLGSAIRGIPAGFNNDSGMTSRGSDFWAGLLGYTPADETKAKAGLEDSAREAVAFNRANPGRPAPAGMGWLGSILDKISGDPNKGIEEYYAQHPERRSQATQPQAPSYATK